MRDCVEMSLEKTKKNNAYGQILKSSSIMGGAVGIDLLIGMVANHLRKYLAWVHIQHVRRG
jgi:hypothetical protein